MAVEVILLEDVKGLGKEGDVVTVADGYARNFLIPRKKAAWVTEATRRMIEKRQREKETRLAAERAEAEALAKKLSEISCTIVMKAGEEGKLFGSVTSHQVAEALKQMGFSVDKNQIELEQPIKELGVYTVPIKLHHGIKASVKVWIVQE